ncbi:hypothetical protein C482_05281 [Natrialba chahannaoensis JCM 10990]|uniref:Uncharacterized protein n=1 Tax=Natrialba chahannaoensis JCM 10990 TaxID=1227492 RepID=M0AXW3_9EURY|nr:hypothetical protein [Natrialba chahannaoensis]ELZ02264.1 hypothetical protein C482_05281 [Natrialba chahannaoensis JCM 10990]
MDAIITGESERIGLSVIDNNDIEHLIEMTESGKIRYHEQDGYPDKAANRPLDENEHVNQARRFAKWHVYRERGYDTLPRYHNPNAIVGAMLAVGSMSEPAIDEQFGELLDTVKTHNKGDYADVQVAGVETDQILVYRQDIYVEPDPLDQEQPLAEQFAEYFSDPVQTLQNLLGDNPDQRLNKLLSGEAGPATQLPAFDLETVSSLHYLYNDGGSKQTHNEPAVSDREPDARIELLPLDPSVFDSRRQLLFSHLGNQVRDRFLLMGCEPPAVFQQQGLGSFDGLKMQQLLDMYDRYFLADSAAGTWDPGTLP